MHSQPHPWIQLSIKSSLSITTAPYITRTHAKRYNFFRRRLIHYVYYILGKHYHRLAMYHANKMGDSICNMPPITSTLLSSASSRRIIEPIVTDMKLKINHNFLRRKIVVICINKRKETTYHLNALRLFPGRKIMPAQKTIQSYLQAVSIVIWITIRAQHFITAVHVACSIQTKLDIRRGIISLRP